jgi:hypothetical protein
MSAKKIILSVCSFFYLACCFGQEELIEKKNRLNDNVTETFHVQKANEQIKDGAYEAFYRRKTPIAIGNYTKGKKTGVWRFYDPKGTLMQVYNYDLGAIEFEAIELKNASDFFYTIDKEVTDSDKVTKPLKAGGRYYGYLSYLGLYKIPFDPYYYGTYGCIAAVELVISPLGRLADYKVRCACDPLEYDQTISMDLRLFKEEDRKFIPATYNGEAVVSRILIKCRVNIDGSIDYF